jgi:hypothetical protein
VIPQELADHLLAVKQLLKDVEGRMEGWRNHAVSNEEFIFQVIKETKDVLQRIEMKLNEEAQ